MIISSTQNEKVKYLAKLQMKKYRDREKKFLVEGFYPLTFALDNNHILDEVFVCPPLFRDKFDNHKLVLGLEARRIQITEITKDVYYKISSHESPEGLIGLATQKETKLSNHIHKSGALYLIAESVEKLTNLGALFRLADNCGVSALIICDMRADVYNPEVIRSSLGAFFSVSHYVVSSEEAIEFCRKNQIQTLATSPSASKAYTEVNMRESTAVVIGAEYPGLSDLWLSSATQKVLIPMFGQTNSLSIPTSAAVILYEAIRQRS